MILNTIKKKQNKTPVHCSVNIKQSKTNIQKEKRKSMVAAAIKTYTQGFENTMPGDTGRRGHLIGVLTMG